MTKKEQRLFNLARAVALCSEHRQFHVGCVIVNQKILAVANNQTHSHPLQKKLNRLRFDLDDTCQNYLHAELSAILKVKNTSQLKNASIYIYRETLTNEIAMSRPCPACLAKIKEVGIKTMYYTTQDGYSREEIKV